MDAMARVYAASPAPRDDNGFYRPRGGYGVEYPTVAECAYWLPLSAGNCMAVWDITDIEEGYDRSAFFRSNVPLPDILAIGLGGGNYAVLCEEERTRVRADGWLA